MSEVPNDRLAYKAYEIEELVDIYFYRRAGYVVARLSPNAVSILAGVVGAIGGALVGRPRWALVGVGLLVAHGVIDSADGQLARMTGRTSEFGRVLDGLAGYATHLALYLGLVAASGPVWGWGTAFALAAVAGFCTAIHAQMYDYHRTAYAGFAIHGRVPTELMTPSVSGVLRPVVRGYAAMQRALVGLHRMVEQDIARDVCDGRVPDSVRHLYRECFYRPPCRFSAGRDPAFSKRFPPEVFHRLTAW
ncbi:MAG: CDP-alcohol phosphatidyltransferase family protein [Acidimicrobiia bacterium]|nr:CDP-alcohol phosphatidyltransferase family protein [Acidimicrobiia bacterium]